MLQIVVTVIGSEIERENITENGYLGVELYPNPWYLGDVGFRCSLTSTDYTRGGPREIHDDFPDTHRGKAQITLELGTSADSDAPYGKSVPLTLFPSFFIIHWLLGVTV